MAGFIALLLILSLAGGAPAQSDGDVRHYANVQMRFDKEGTHLESRHKVVKELDNVQVEIGFIISD